MDESIKRTAVSGPAIAQSQSDSPANSRQIRFEASPGFVDWLTTENISLAASTYQASRLLLIGRVDRSLSVVASYFPRCMGLFVEGETLWVASAFQIWRLQNMLHANGSGPFDKRFVPTVAYNTGEVFAHDIARDQSNNQLVFVNTAFSCVAASSDVHSFRPVWQPPFIDQLVPTDLCHMNGLAIRDGKLNYVTVCGRSTSPRGWRQDRIGAGIAFDTRSGEIACQGLTMPHSPRWHKGRLWLLNSGSGELGYADEGRFVPVAFCPGYARGLAFWKHYAIVGLSKPRRPQAFDDLPLKTVLGERHVTPLCGVTVIDVRTGRATHQLTIGGDVVEMYDVAVLPNSLAPSAVGTTLNELRANVWFEQRGQTEGWVGNRGELRPG